MPTPRQRRSALEQFEYLLRESLIKKSRVKESRWQTFFDENPYVLTQTIPLRLDMLFSQVRLSSGRPDYLFHTCSMNDCFSTTGFIELKRPDQTVVDIYGSHLDLSRKASIALVQTRNYLTDLQGARLVTQAGTFAMGNNKSVFIIIGSSDEIANKCKSEMLHNQFLSLLPSGFQLITYDELFSKFQATPRPPVFFLNTNLSPRIHPSFFSLLYRTCRDLAQLDTVERDLFAFSSMRDFVFGPLEPIREYVWQGDPKIPVNFRAIVSRLRTILLRAEVDGRVTWRSADRAGATYRQVSELLERNNHPSLANATEAIVMLPTLKKQIAHLNCGLAVAW